MTNLVYPNKAVFTVLVFVLGCQYITDTPLAVFIGNLFLS